MEATQKTSDWNVAAEEQRWNEMAEQGQKIHEKSEKNPTLWKSQFYHLCLAEADAASCVSRSPCFGTRIALLAELRRLILEPTEPSARVLSIEAYRASQKSWLEWMVSVYEKTS